MIPAAAFLFAALALSAAPPEPVVLNPDGAWCWFQDERALVHRGKLWVAAIGANGDVRVTTWDMKAGAVSIACIHPRFQADDHNTPALLLRRDGRLMAFYTTHGGPPGKRLMYTRTTVRPYDASEWAPAGTFDAQVPHGFTYANPFQLSAENNRIYLFWRALHFNPTWTASDDLGRSWLPGRNHILYQPGERPYVKYASNGSDTIHFAFTDGHPNRPFLNNLYHAYYRKGGLYRSDGAFIRRLEEGPVKTAEATRVYDGAAPTGEAWVWDIHLDRAGRPVIAYSTHPDPMDHRYRYARWNGRSWEDHQIGFAGRRLYKSQEYYSGGICLDPDDVNVVYASSNVDIAGGGPSGNGRYEIWRGATGDRGRTWAWRRLTQDSAADNLRPIVPAGHPGKTFVLWFRGRYTTYTNYQTEVVALTDARVPAIVRKP